MSKKDKKIERFAKAVAEVRAAWGDLGEDITGPVEMGEIALVVEKRVRAVAGYEANGIGGYVAGTWCLMEQAFQKMLDNLDHPFYIAQATEASGTFLDTLGGVCERFIQESEVVQQDAEEPSVMFALVDQDGNKVDPESEHH